ncbi:VanZ family protein [Halorussus gelatinilyticus]|uniref:VanZ family protein n=1 Tax=Halorussus gelatinilyticus TaxID=2937524 RepID=A0A8U0IKR3_9EURY|nr:VanZ family protein [Halorussus gelatinilyticus]UPW01221.1 VanZ family protein [Halorussus gelatinilyticus]
MELDALRPPTWLRWLAVAVVAGGIFYASVLDSPSSGLPSLGPLGVFGIDKWLHALAYAALAGALAGALAPGRSPAVTAALAALLSVGYGVGIEFVQAPLARRHFSVADMLADGVGAGAAVLGWRLLVNFAGGSREREKSSDVDS